MRVSSVNSSVALYKANPSYQQNPNVKVDFKPNVDTVSFGAKTLTARLFKQLQLQQIDVFGKISGCKTLFATINDCGYMILKTHRGSYVKIDDAPRMPIDDGFFCIDDKSIAKVTRTNSLYWSGSPYTKEDFNAVKERTYEAIKQRFALLKQAEESVEEFISNAYNIAILSHNQKPFAGDIKNLALGIVHTDDGQILFGTCFKLAPGSKQGIYKIPPPSPKFYFEDMSEVMQQKLAERLSKGEFLTIKSLDGREFIVKEAVDKEHPVRHAIEIQQINLT